jgi:hypothetical protein
MDAATLPPDDISRGPGGADARHPRTSAPSRALPRRRGARGHQCVTGQWRATRGSTGALCPPLPRERAGMRGRRVNPGNGLRADLPFLTCGPIVLPSHGTAPIVMTDVQETMVARGLHSNRHDPDPPRRHPVNPVGGAGPAGFVPESPRMDTVPTRAPLRNDCDRKMGHPVRTELTGYQSISRYADFLQMQHLSLDMGTGPVEDGDGVGRRSEPSPGPIGPVGAGPGGTNQFGGRDEGKE